MKGRSYLLIIISIMIFSFAFEVNAKNFSFYVDSTCEVNEEDCYRTLDEAFEKVEGEATSANDVIDLNICNDNISISHSYTINGKLKFVIDDVSNENKFEFNGNNNTITTGKYIEFTGNSELTISNLNIRDTLADANNSSFTLGFYSQHVNLNSVSVTSLKYSGIFGGDNLSEYDLDGVQVSGAEVGIDYLGKTLNINNGTFDDNTFGFFIGASETTITNSKINSISAYDGAVVNVDNTNTLVDNPLMIFANNNDYDGFDGIDLDENFVISFSRDSKIKMNLVKESNAVIEKNSSKIDILKLFNGVVDLESSNVLWTTTDSNVVKIDDGFAVLVNEGEATVAGTIPNTEVKLSVNFKVSEEKDKSLKGTIKNIVSNPKTYSTLFIVWLLVFVVVTTTIAYTKRKKEVEAKDII